jgi:hypothetical protein
VIARTLLPALAGRVDDDLLVWARALVADGDDARAVELLTAALVADRVALPAEVRADLVAAARATRSVLNTEVLLPPASDIGPDTTPHVFDPPRAGPSTALLAATVRAECDRRGLAGRGVLAWRRTPAGSASGPLPRPVLLLEVDDPDVRSAVALVDALDRVGVTVSVEVLARGGALPAYHAAARAVGWPIGLAADTSSLDVTDTVQIAPVVPAVATGIVAAEPTAPAVRPGDGGPRIGRFADDDTDSLPEPAALVDAAVAAVPDAGPPDAGPLDTAAFDGDTRPSRTAEADSWMRPSWLNEPTAADPDNREDARPAADLRRLGLAAAPDPEPVAQAPAATLSASDLFTPTHPDGLRTDDRTRLAPLHPPPGAAAAPDGGQTRADDDTSADDLGDISPIGEPSVAPLPRRGAAAHRRTDEGSGEHTDDTASVPGWSVPPPDLDPEGDIALPVRRPRPLPFIGGRSDDGGTRPDPLFDPLPGRTHDGREETALFHPADAAPVPDLFAEPDRPLPGGIDRSPGSERLGGRRHRGDLTRPPDDTATDALAEVTEASVHRLRRHRLGSARTPEPAPRAEAEPSEPRRAPQPQPRRAADPGSGRWAVSGGDGGSHPPAANGAHPATASGAWSMAPAAPSSPASTPGPNGGGPRPLFGARPADSAVSGPNGASGHPTGPVPRPVPSPAPRPHAADPPGTGSHPRPALRPLEGPEQAGALRPRPTPHPSARPGKEPSAGDATSLDPLLGLRPESVERMSAGDRALLAQLQAEMGLRPGSNGTGPRRGAPRPRPARTDPPDIAG